MDQRTNVGHIPTAKDSLFQFTKPSKLVFSLELVISGDPRRPYPQDIEMRSGWLGRLMDGVASETDQPVTGDSTLQDLMQPSVSVSQPVGGLGTCRFISNQEY